eukprot:gene27569-36366_t
MAISSALKFLIDRCNIDISSLSTWASIFGGHDHSYHHKSYQPAAGVLWYLDAQMLPAYELYFKVLVIMQPLLAATIIWVHLTVLIVFMWRRDTTLLDLSFAMSLLLSHIEVIAKMKNLLLITIGIIVPTVLSPVMLHLWVIKDKEDAESPSDFILTDPQDDRKIVIKDPDSSNRRYGEVSFQFDKVFWTDVKQEEVFDSACRVQVDRILDGYNCCCFAYGQTGSGKTYTMFGNDGDIRGVIPRSVEYLFQKLSKMSSSSEVAMVCSFLEIYNDQIRDLGKAYLVAMGVEASTSKALYEKTSNLFENLAGKRGNPYFAPAFHRVGSNVAMAADDRPGLKEVQDEYNTMNYEIREDNEGNVFVKDLSLVPVTTIEEVMSLITMGLSVRATHETKMNAFSSRSHTVFTITILQKDKITGQATTGMLNLVDLAGSERLKKSESQGVRLKEALHINTSLTALGKVIMALDTTSEQTHVPFRDSKLTRVLQNSLGGNSFTSVITAIYPSPKHYEECLSTLQFANRCRNVRNNPRVNYVEDTEDKDRKIKKLMDEVQQLRIKFSQGGNFDNTSNSNSSKQLDDRFSSNKLVAILKKLGIEANVTSDGALMVNGRKFSLDGIDGSDTASVDQRNGKDGMPSSSSAVNTDKLQKMVKDLKETNANYATKAKERKVELEEQGRELQKLSNELVKCQLTIQHKEFEYNVLKDEKDRSLLEQKALLEHRFAEQTRSLLEKNAAVVSSQQAIVDQYPVSMKDYSEKLKQIEKKKLSFEKPLKMEFEKHLNHMEKSRLEEIDLMKKQYEHWLTEKDKALSGFVEGFNAYRLKKSEQLRLAEHEIVRLYNYTEKIEKILEDVEKGRFQVQKVQGTRGGKSTTGVTNFSAVPGEYATSAIMNSSELMGAVILPRGLKPTNPLKVFEGSSNNGLELTKRIVEKHKERVARIDRMKATEFRKSLHLASKPTSTSTGMIDESLQQQVRQLLESKSNKSRAKVPLDTAPHSARDPLPDVVKPPSNRPTTAGYAARNSNYGVYGSKSAAVTSSDRDELVGSEFNHSNAQLTVNEGSNEKQSYNVSFDLMAELEELRVRVSEEEITTQKVLDELASNETLQYIQKLESENEKLRKEVLSFSNQLLASKVAHGALQRTVR